MNNLNKPPQMIKQIKFSHFYLKMRSAMNINTMKQFERLEDCFKRVKLLEVIEVKLESLSKDFLNYDTTFLTVAGNYREVMEQYELPKKGVYLLLIFLGERGIFTTIRRSTYEKFEYYVGAIGETFQVVIEEDGFKVNPNVQFGNSLFDSPADLGKSATS